MSRAIQFDSLKSIFSSYKHSSVKSGNLYDYILPKAIQFDFSLSVVHNVKEIQVCVKIFYTCLKIFYTILLLILIRTFKFTYQMGLDA